jgi:hypothetical protein
MAKPVTKSRRYKRPEIEKDMGPDASQSGSSRMSKSQLEGALSDAAQAHERQESEIRRLEATQTRRGRKSAGVGTGTKQGKLENEFARGRRAKEKDAKPKGQPSRRSPGWATTLTKPTPAFTRLFTGNPKSIVLAEFTGALVLVQVASLTRGEGLDLEQTVPVFIVYLVLFFFAEFGDDTARVVAAFGLLVLFVLFLVNGGQIFTALSDRVSAGASPEGVQAGRMRDTDSTRRPRKRANVTEAARRRTERGPRR